MTDSHKIFMHILYGMYNIIHYLYEGMIDALHYHKASVAKAGKREVDLVEGKEISGI